LRHSTGEKGTTTRRVQRQNEQQQPRAQFESDQPETFHWTIDILKVTRKLRNFLPALRRSFDKDA
jgi:hypothetical protein